MVTLTAIAESNVLCRATHGPSGVVLATDAPADMGGQASSFSPTDLVGAALLTCIMTTMGLAANRLGADLTGMRGSVAKTMAATAPRRIARLQVVLEMPGSVAPEMRQKLEHAAMHCPVHQTLHPETVQEIVVNWTL